MVLRKLRIIICALTGRSNYRSLDHNRWHEYRCHAQLARRCAVTQSCHVDNTQQVHLIGIATWGIVDHREHVIGKQVSSSKETKS